MQSRIYSFDPVTGKIERLGAGFQGSLSEPEMLTDGGVATTGALGTEVQVYVQRKNFEKIPGRPGTYFMLSAAAHSPRVAFVYSAQQAPAEIYIADSSDSLLQAKPITAFNALFTQRTLPQGRSYTWTADDGTKVEGWLIYPPKNLAQSTCVC